MSTTLRTVEAMGPSITTANATPAILANYQTVKGKGYLVTANVIAVDSAGAQASSYTLSGTFKTTTAGVLAQVGSTTSVHSTETDSNWACTMAASGTEIQITATGEADVTVHWRANVDIIQVGFESGKT